MMHQNGRREMEAHNNETLRFLGLLDLPEHSSITIDGEPLVLRRSDFVGFFNLPTTNADGFHFVSVRAGSHHQRSNGHNQQQGQPSSVVVGFVIPGQGNLIRRYDPVTEEVSSKDVDALTVENLLTSLRRGQIDSQRIVDYTKLLYPPKQRSWTEGTGLVSFRLLGRRGLGFGNKIVPDAFGSDDGDETKTDSMEEDGAPSVYPPIPVLHNSSKTELSQRQRLHHPGTKRYLSQLDPTSRTTLLVHPDACTRVFEKVLRDYYDGCWQDLVGDVQLSYVLFLQLHCYSSLMHWRDLVAMLSLVNPSVLSLDRETVGSMFAGLLKTLSWQVTTMDEGLFDDVEMSGDNVLIPSFKRLLLVHDTVHCHTAWQASRNGLQRILQQRFPSQFPCDRNPSDETRPRGDLQDMSDDGSCDDFDDDDDEGDGPVVVASDEVEASLARISTDLVSSSPRGVAAVEYSQGIREQYPLLFAARVVPHEDIVMTCARVLDQANDVSLVREAADYLQRIEASQHEKNHPVID
jgi:A1 cistron-splicing factor AAR2